MVNINLENPQELEETIKNFIANKTDKNNFKKILTRLSKTEDFTKILYDIDNHLSLDDMIFPEYSEIEYTLKNIHFDENPINFTLEFGVNVINDDSKLFEMSFYLKFEKETKDYNMYLFLNSLDKQIDISFEYPDISFYVNKNYVDENLDLFLNSTSPLNLANIIYIRHMNKNIIAKVIDKFFSLIGSKEEKDFTKNDFNHLVVKDESGNKIKLNLKFNLKDHSNARQLLDELKAIILKFERFSLDNYFNELTITLPIPNKEIKKHDFYEIRAISTTSTNEFQQFLNKYNM